MPEIGVTLEFSLMLAETSEQSSWRLYRPKRHNRHDGKIDEELTVVSKNFFCCRVLINRAAQSRAVAEAIDCGFASSVQIGPDSSGAAYDYEGSPEIRMAILSAESHCHLRVTHRIGS